MQAENERLKKNLDEDNARANACDNIAHELRDELKIERRSVELLRETNGADAINAELWRRWQDAERRLAQAELELDETTRSRIKNKDGADFYKKRLSVVLDIFREFGEKLIQEGFVWIACANDD